MKFINVLKENSIQLGKMFSMMLPRGRQELTLFACVIVFYFSYSLILIFHTSIVDGNGILRSDIYFNFDNQIYFFKGDHYKLGHPLIKQYLLPFILLGSLFPLKAKAFLFVLICTLLISLSVLYIFKYLKEIIGLTDKILYMVTAFFVFSFTNLILCFTTESFSISLFLLSFSVYYYSIYIANDKKVSFLPSFALVFALGGVTITNFVKGFLPMLFVKGEFYMRIIRIFILSFLWVLTLGALELKYKMFSLFVPITTQYTRVDIYAHKGGFFHQVVDLFFGAPIFSPSIIIDIEQYDGLWKTTPGIDIFVYQHWWQYLFIFFLATLVGFSILMNYKNKLVQLLFLLFSADIALHVFYGFGRGEAFIYGAHWIYVVPLFLGWLYRSLGEKYRKGFTALFSFMLCGLILNNGNQLINFIQMAIKYFPSEI